MIQEEYKIVRDGGAVKNGVFHFAKAVLTCLAASAVMFVIAALLLTYTPLPEIRAPSLSITTERPAPHSRRALLISSLLRLLCAR